MAEATVAVLGLGAMGSRMALNLIKAGHTVTVWNRTATAANPLVTAGAKRAETPREAAGQSQFVITMLRDEKVSQDVWLDPKIGAMTGMSENGVAIESSTVTPDWIHALGTAADQRGVKLLEAPVVGSRPQADAGKLIYIVGGDKSVVAEADPLLKVMGTTIHHVGSLGSAALVKLATNALLGVQVTALAELIGLLKRAGADVGRALQAMSSTPPWSPAANAFSSSMLTSNFAPQFPIQLIEKDFGYTVRVAGSAKAVPTINAARNVFRHAINDGLGSDNMTGVIRLFAD